MNAVVAQARTWVGVRWQHQGRSRDGVDCAGLVIEVAKVTHGNTFDLRNYAAQATDETMLALCSEHMDSVPLADMQPGDVVVMGFANQRHMGFLSDYPGALGLIHAYATSRKVVEHRLDSVWRQRCIAAFRFREAG